MIARKMDSHAQLVAALEAAVEQLEQSQAYVCGDPEHPVSIAAGNELAMRQARAALLAAKGQRNE